MAHSSPNLVDATLGIDIGSTSTRACLWVPSRDLVIHVENTIGIPREAYNHPGDFPTVGFPFEPREDTYLGGNVDPKRTSTSLKYGFYVLADPEDASLIEQYHLVEPMMRRKDDPEFRRRLRQGLVQLLLTVNRDVQSTCKVNRVQITRIGLSIPAQWTMEFEDVYRDIVMEVFGHPSENIAFHTETESLAHFLLQEWSHEFQVPEGEDYSVFLFLDFGGHNMNGCIFNLVQGDPAEKPSVYRIGDPFGAGGGSEHWTYNIGKRALLYRNKIPGLKVSPEEECALLEEFNRKKGSLGPSQAEAPFQFGQFRTKLSAADIKECFEEGHRAVLDMAKDKVEQASKFRATTHVVITGGTAKHPDVRSELSTFCREAALPEPNFVAAKSTNYSTGMIAQGVAMAASNHLTIPQFMERGAAFGLQRRCCPDHGNTNPDKLWDNTATFLLRSQLSCFFRTGSQDEWKIICDPFFERHPSKHLRYNRCYDFLYLGRSKRGNRKITLSLVNDKDETALIIKTTWLRYGAGSQVVEMESPPLPMYFDAGTNCVHVDSSQYDLKHLIFETDSSEQHQDLGRNATAGSKTRGNHHMKTRAGNRQTSPSDDAEMTLAGDREPANLPGFTPINKGIEPAPNPRTPSTTRASLPNEEVEMEVPSDSVLPTGALQAPTPTPSSSALRLRRRRRGEPYPCLRPNSRPQKPKKPFQASEEPITESSFTLRPPLTAPPTPDPTPRQSGRSKPNYKRGTAPRLNPYRQTITYHRNGDNSTRPYQRSPSERT